ncbi:hypothetical protein FWK35_00005779 [Aphis craccivora]|uniref:Uncharacterized protein n=1 Tax=Aphis craccivora TaxID=307492 RepID=A0A6G0ZE33_APHCR|nr:hypothetical protein FWK35_00005779 [Aphis craccivora]
MIGFQWQSEYPWCIIIDVKSKNFLTVFQKRFKKFCIFS